MRKSVIICDLDGTLAEVEHRKHFINQEEKDWKSFHEHCVHDEPYKQVVDTVQALCQIHDLEVYIYTGRTIDTLEVTKNWLENVGIFYSKIRMRTNEKFWIKDDQLKENWLNEDFPGNEKDYVYLVLEDRKSVVDMWRRNGLKCFEVNEGNF